MQTFPEISHAELVDAIDNGMVTLLDCNGTESFKAGHIPHAIDFEAKSAVLADLLPRNKSSLVVAYCGGPSCDAYLRGAKAAQTLGYTHVWHYAGGISGWKAAHAEVESAGRF